MTSLSEAYRNNARGVSSLRRLYAGTALVLAGAVLAVLAVVVATTDVFGAFLADEFAARELAGVLGGLAVPAVLVGVFTVLPAGRWVRAAAAISASICLLGVVLFYYAYPEHWLEFGRELTPFVATVYLIGLFSAIGCLFVAIVNFKTRNDPGGTLEMNVTRTDETRVVAVERSNGLGGIGLLGTTPDGDVETQTNRPPSSTTESDGSRAASDGGSAASSSAVDGQAGAGDETPAPGSIPADRYCGNCKHFDYVRDSSGIVPYCGLRTERMDDMDACEEWTANRW